MTRKGSGVPPAVLDRALQLVCERTGLVFARGRIAGFAAKLAEGARQSGIGDVAAYVGRIEQDDAMLDDLIVEITVGETYFFRDPRQFALLHDEILPALMAGGSGRDLRVWSAACASGEEAYTLAMVLREAGLADRSQVVGSDVSRAALERARRASYTRWSLRGVEESTINRYFVQHGRRFDLDPAIRAAVEFRYLNLAEDRYPSLVGGIANMDVILCRNVLIYFDAPTVAAVARRLISSLSADGWLLLGGADPPLRQLVSCDVVVTDAGLAYRRPRSGSSARPAAPHSAAPAVMDTGTPHRSASTARALKAGAAAERRERATRPQTVRPAAEVTDGAPAAALKVRTLANRGELLAADAACMAALKEHPLDAELVYLHAVLLTEAGRHADAAAALRRALYLDRNLVVAHMALGDVLARLGDERGADRAFANAARLLAAMPAEQPVRGSDDEAAGRLLTMVRARRSLTDHHAA